MSNKKNMYIWQSIVKRETAGRVVTRTLECGHTQLQIPGGRSGTATRARCKECGEKPENKAGLRAPQGEAAKPDAWSGREEQPATA